MKLVFTTGVVMVSALALVACQGDPGAQTTEASAAPSPSDSAPGVSAETENRPASPSPDPTVTPNPEPTVIEIRADDLVSALPTNKQMSKIQGFKFKENTNWANEADEGPQWVSATPLSQRQSDQILLGTFRSVQPKRCAPLGVIEAWGIPARWATPDTVQAVGYSKRLNSERALKENLMLEWNQVIYVMDEGRAQEFSENARNLWSKCATVRSIGPEGDIVVNDHRAIAEITESFTSGNAFVTTRTDKWRASNNAEVFVVLEAVGRALVASLIVLVLPDEDGIARAGEVLNNLSNRLAVLQDIERSPVDLLNLVPFTPQPNGVAPPSPPANEKT